MEKSTLTFDKQSTQALKGVAVLMLLFHHLFFREARWSEYGIISWLSQDTIIGITHFFKISISLFLIVSGYGMYKSATKQ